jgi:hypothetical protein
VTRFLSVHSKGTKGHTGRPASARLAASGRGAAGRVRRAAGAECATLPTRAKRAFVPRQGPALRPKVPSTANPWLSCLQPRQPPSARTSRARWPGPRSTRPARASRARALCLGCPAL